MQAPVPVDEPERLRELRDYLVLDTEPEQAFAREPCCARAKP